MADVSDGPSSGRLLAAFIAAPAAASAVLTLVLAVATLMTRVGPLASWALIIGFYAGGALIVALTLTLIFGAPAYLILRRRVTRRKRWAMIVGGSIAAAPYGFYMLGVLAFSGVLGPSVALSLLIPLLFLALLGVFAGWVFWRIAYGRAMSS